MRSKEDLTRMLYSEEPDYEIRPEEKELPLYDAFLFGCKACEEMQAAGVPITHQTTIRAATMFLSHWIRSGEFANYQEESLTELRMFFGREK
jgi:hypothetical protein